MMVAPLLKLVEVSMKMVPSTAVVQTPINIKLSHLKIFVDDKVTIVMQYHNGNT